MGLTEKETNAQQDKANAYKHMFELWAWKDYVKGLEEMERAYIDDFVQGAKDHDSIRGAVSCLRKIKAELEYITR